MLAPDGGAGGDVHAAAARGISGSGSALPHKETIQNSFGGYDISNVQAHADAAAAQGAAAMGADAYATGNHVVFGKGGDNLHTAAHEAAHVVQQRAGVSLSGGVGKSGDAYEQHADRVADAVVQGKSAEGILGEMAGGGGLSSGVQMKEGDETSTSNDVSLGPPGKGQGFFDHFGGVPELPLKERLRLESETGDRINVAFTQYVDACNEHIAALKRAATQNRDIALVVIDVAFGLIAPGGGRALAALLDKLPIKAPDLVYKGASALLDNAGTIVSSVLAGGKRAAGMAMESALRNTEAESFVDGLKTQFAIITQDTRGSFAACSDSKLAVICAAFDARVATKSAYSAEIGALLAAFKRDVEPIGASETLDGPQPWLGVGPLIAKDGLVRVESGSGQANLVRVRLLQRSPGGGKPELEFVSFVSSRLSTVAANKAMAVQPRGIQTVRASDINGFPGKGPEH